MASEKIALEGDILNLTNNKTQKEQELQTVEDNLATAQALHSTLSTKNGELTLEHQSLEKQVSDVDEMLTEYKTNSYENTLLTRFHELQDESTDTATKKEPKKPNYLRGSKYY